MTTKWIIPMLLISMISCNSNDEKADAYGNFEAKEIIISAENNGKLIHYTIKEGQKLEKGTLIGIIDTIPLSLQKEQLKISKDITRQKSKGVLSQIDVLNAQLKTAKTEETRIKNLFKEDAATQQQVDNIEGQIDVIENQITNIKLNNAPILSELKSIDNRIEQLNDQLNKCRIVNPINGTVLTNFAEENEITAFGKPLYTIADIETLELRVYVSETQLPKVKINETVNVKIDYEDTVKDFEGVVSWVASEAEFTPKIIQTKEERVNLVYAVKVLVENDGSLKIGMPGEIWFN